VGSPTPYSETLRLAADVLGSRGQLAACLRVSRRALDAWIAGDRTPPLPVFLAALDVVADGPFAEERALARGPAAHS
jgi:hypothetical protein